MTTTITESYAPANRSLWTIEADLERLEAALEATDEDGNPVFTEAEQFAAIDAYLDGAQGDELKAKLDNTCALIKLREGMSESRRKESARIAALARGDEGFAKQFKERLRLFLKRHEWTKFETPRFKLGRQNNGGIRALVISEDVVPEDLDEKYQKTIIVADTEMLRIDAEVAENCVARMIGILAIPAYTEEEQVEVLKFYLSTEPLSDEDALKFNDLKRSALRIGEQTHLELIRSEYLAHKLPDGIVLEPRGEHLRIR